jgi:hypothetical protein
MAKVQTPAETTAVEKSNGIVKHEQVTSLIHVADLTRETPNLDEATPLPFDLMADYWTPQNPGESKRVFFDRVDLRSVKDMNSEETIELECAFFIEKVNNEAKSISNGSRRLVGAIQSLGILRGSALLITYLGKKKNKSNNFMSDAWSIKPLVINVSAK